jgi:hypothetical protein
MTGDPVAGSRKQRLADFASKLKGDNKNVYLEIQGFTDASGDPKYNETLGDASGPDGRTVKAPQVPQQAGRAAEPHGDHLVRRGLYSVVLATTGEVPAGPA